MPLGIFDRNNTLQCMEKITNAAHVVDPRKQQKFNVVPVSSGSHTTVLKYLELTVLLSIKQHLSTVASARPLTGNRNIAP